VGSVYWWADVRWVFVREFKGMGPESRFLVRPAAFGSSTEEISLALA
jgi:hypothetical protein